MNALMQKQYLNSKTLYLYSRLTQIISQGYDTIYHAKFLDQFLRLTRSLINLEKEIELSSYRVLSEIEKMLKFVTQIFWQSIRFFHTHKQLLSILTKFI